MKVLKTIFKQSDSSKFYVMLYIIGKKNCINTDVWIKPICAMYDLQSLQGKAPGFHKLVNALNSLEDYII